MGTTRACVGGTTTANEETQHCVCVRGWEDGAGAGVGPLACNNYSCKQEDRRTHSIVRCDHQGGWRGRGGAGQDGGAPAPTVRTKLRGGGCGVTVGG